MEELGLVCRRAQHYRCGCGLGPNPKVQTEDFWKAMKMLRPMPLLRILRLTVAPNFLDILDMKLYKDMTRRLPALEVLWLGHPDFFSIASSGIAYREHVPLHHLAAFCSMLPKLVEVRVGMAEGATLLKYPNPTWACWGVRTLNISLWKGPDSLPDLILHSLQTYFPNSDLAQKGVEEISWRFR